MARDPAGNVYFTAPFNHRVRKIDTHGKITTFAGTGKKGFSGDGGPARRARLHTPYGVAADQQGNVYIADYLNRRVRKVDPSGVITTFAGTGETPDIFDDDPHHGDGGPAALAPIDAPQQLATDQAGNVYIGGACTIHKVSPAGIISTVIGGDLITCGYAGDGGPATEAKIGVPAQMAVDSAGNLYVADPQHKRIRKIAANGIISTFAGTGKGVFSGDGGPARKANIYNPLSVAVDGKDNVYFSQHGPRSSSRIRRVDGNGIITTVAGNGKLGRSPVPGSAPSASRTGFRTGCSSTPKATWSSPATPTSGYGAW